MTQLRFTTKTQYHGQYERMVLGEKALMVLCHVVSLVISHVLYNICEGHAILAQCTVNTNETTTEMNSTESGSVDP